MAPEWAYLWTERYISSAQMLHKIWNCILFFRLGDLFNSSSGEYHVVSLGSEFFHYSYACVYAGARNEYCVHLYSLLRNRILSRADGCL